MIDGQIEEVVMYKSCMGKLHETKEDAELENLIIKKKRLETITTVYMMENNKYHYHGISPILNYGFTLDTPIRAFISKACWVDGENPFKWLLDSFNNIKNDTPHPEQGPFPI